MAGKSDLRQLIEKKLGEWSASSGNKGNKLKGELLLWGSALPSGTIGDNLESQIMFKAQNRKVAPEQIVEQLFSLPDADSFMLELQLSQ